MNNEITSGIKEFILGGNANFTIHQESSNGKGAVTVKYRVQRNDNGSCWFVYTEVDNSGNTVSDGKNLKYQGYLKKDLTFNVGNKGMVNYNKVAIGGLLWVLNHSLKLPKMVHIYHHGRCSVCGRKLTDYDSLRCGIGPTCRKKIGKF